MENITESQIDKINAHLSNMSEANQDLYIQKLEESGVINNILSKIGSAGNNIKKLQKQKDSISKQLANMIQAIKVSKAKGISQQDKEKDIKALTELKAQVDSINVNIPVPEAKED